MAPIEVSAPSKSILRLFQTSDPFAVRGLVRDVAAKSAFDRPHFTHRVGALIGIEHCAIVDAYVVETQAVEGCRRRLLGED